MKKKLLFLLPLVGSLLAGCNFKDVNAAVVNWTNQHILDPIGTKIPGLASSGKTVNLEFEEGKDLTKENKKGVLGDFSLVAPAENAVVHDLPTFTWTESENAVSYTLEVCSSSTFDANSSSIIYAKESNIEATSFKLTSNLRKKNINYYWRVTAVNEFNSRSVGKTKESETRIFRYEVESSGEIDIGVGEKGDWALHEMGSYADISIDHNDFFGTGSQDSLVITFTKEDTLNGTGVENSRGWIVVQKAMELDLFDQDAFYCNFYFMGHDSTILIRIIDQDGELWYKQVKFTMDTRQLALLRFDEFTLRTGDTVVQNEEFNHEHIQAIEVCFEKTFGDGCCVLGDIKAVSFDDYKDLFIKKLNYDIVPVDKWINENYNFKKTISEDKTELTLEYSNEVGFNGNEKTMNQAGWGFAKIPVERYFSDGNAIKVKVKYTGYSNKVNSIIRIYEPDKDRWSYTHPFSVLTADEYQELTIPYMAFEQSSIVEGKRQFYFVSQIQLGLNNCYGAGTLSYKDFEIVELPSVSQNPRVVENDGVIEDFNNYVYRGEAYQQWETSVDNKDEGIFLLTDEMYHTAGNIQAGKFTYKSDMSMASYDIYTDVKAEGLNAIKFWIKDASVPNTAVSQFSSFTGEDVSPTVIIQVVHKDGRWYRYVIDKAPRVWTEYTIPFSAFELFSGREYETSDPVISQNIINFAFGMQYFYKYKLNVGGVETEVAYPLYTQNNPVYMDEIKFASTTSEEAVITSLENALHPDTNKDTILDTFEYANNDELAMKWFALSERGYENIALSNDVSAQGETHSMKLDYKKGGDSPAYALYPTIGSDSESKAVILDIKGDGVATIYVNFYIRAGNNTLHQYRATIAAAPATWTRYTIGFGTDNFNAMTGGPALGKTSLQNIQRLTFGVAGGSGGDISSVYIDNLKFGLNDPTTGNEYKYGVNRSATIE